MTLTESSSVTDSRRGLAAFAGRDGDRTVVWFLSEVLFMDAATVGVSIRAGNFLRPRLRSLALRSPSTCARRAIEVRGLAYLVDSRPVDAKPSAETGGPLGRCVALPGTDRVDRRANVSGPKPGSFSDHFRVGRVTAARRVSSVDARLQAEQRTTGLAGRGRP
jgi:hypothetical protein